MVFIITMLIGHHSLQVHALQIDKHQHHDQVCSVDNCHDKKSLEICEKFQGEQVKVSFDGIDLLDVSHSISIDNYAAISFPDDNLRRDRERIPLAYKQLARSQI